MDADRLRDLDVQSGARLVDFAECARVGDWTLRSALVRYAQRSPVAASAVLELIRRTDNALHPYRRSLEQLPVREVAESSDGVPTVVELLEVARLLHELGDLLARWADDRASVEVPVAEVDLLAGQAFAALADLGVPRETRPPRRAD